MEFCIKRTCQERNVIIEPCWCEKIQCTDIFVFGTWNITNMSSILGDPLPAKKVKIVELMIIGFRNFHCLLTTRNQFWIIRQVGNYFITLLRRYSATAPVFQTWSLFHSQWQKELERYDLVIIRGKIMNQKLVSQKWMQSNCGLVDIFGEIIVGDHKQLSHLVWACRICQMGMPDLDQLRCIQPNRLVDIFPWPFYVQDFKMYFWKLHFFIFNFNGVKDDIQWIWFPASWVWHSWMERIRAFSRTLNATIDFISSRFGHRKISNWSTPDLIDKYQLHQINTETSVTEVMRNITPIRNDLVMHKTWNSSIAIRFNPFKESYLIRIIQSMNGLQNTKYQVSNLMLPHYTNKNTWRSTSGKFQ